MGKAPGRWELYCIIFTTGAAILAIELAASRLMSPMFGTSLYIWGAILSITLIGLSAGYSWGGRMADSLTDPFNRLAKLVLASALWVGLIPLLNTPVALIGLNAGSFLGPIVVTTLLFALPITLLATATPLVFGIINQEEAGSHPARSIGDLFAISTLGSVTGALVTAYGMIPIIGIRWSFPVVAVVLIIVLLPAIWRGTLLRPATIVVAGLLLAEQLPPEHLPRAELNYGFKILARESTRYGEIAVIENEDLSRILLLNGTSQNWVGGSDFDRSHFEYIPVSLSQLARFPNHEKKALVLGLGAGVLVRSLSSRGYKVDVVEIDPAMVGIAERYFNYPAADLPVHVGDARSYLNESRENGHSYGLIYLDTTGGGSQPKHLYNQDAFQLMHDLLTPGGLLITNQLLFVTEGSDQLAHMTAATLEKVFGRAEAFDVYAEDTESGLTNFLVFASKVPSTPFNPAMATERIFRYDRRHGVLTDDWNPGDLWSREVDHQWHANMRSWLGNAAIIPI